MVEQNNSCSDVGQSAAQFGDPSKNGYVPRPRAPARPAARKRIGFPVNSNVISICARLVDWPMFDATACRKMNLTAAARATLEPRLNALVAVEDRLRLACTRPRCDR